MEINGELDLSWNLASFVTKSTFKIPLNQEDVLARPIIRWMMIEIQNRSSTKS